MPRGRTCRDVQGRTRAGTAGRRSLDPVSLLRLKTPAPGAATPATFFGHVVPTLLVAFPSRDGAPRDGRLAFEVRGAGAWTIDLGQRTVAAELQPADVTLTLSTDACALLLQGTVPHDVAVDGDRTKLKHLAELLLAFSRGDDR